MSFDIVSIGSAIVDHFADTDSELIRIDTRSHHESLIAFPLGSKLLINDLKTSVGGGGTNTAAAFAKLGFNTAYLGKVGADTSGDYILENLKQLNISFIGAKEGLSGMSVILNSSEDDRSILTYKGANNQLHPHEICPFETKWIHLSSMLEESWETISSHIIQLKDVKLAFNPSNYQAELGYEALSKLIDRVSVLIMNREEACKLLGLDHRRHRELHNVLKSLYELAPEVVVITDGAKGVHVYDGDAYYHGHPSDSLTVVDATGAGDAFSSTFTACLIKGLDTASAINYAMTNAESVLQSKGTKESLMEWEELVVEAKENERQIDKTSNKTADKITLTRS